MNNNVVLFFFPRINIAHLLDDLFIIHHISYINDYKKTLNIVGCKCKLTGWHSLEKGFTVLFLTPNPSSLLWKRYRAPRGNSPLIYGKTLKRELTSLNFSFLKIIKD